MDNLMKQHLKSLASDTRTLAAQVDATLTAKDKAIMDLIDVLEYCIEYLEPMADADQPAGSHPIANTEMRLMIDAEIAIRDAKRLLP